MHVAAPSGDGEDVACGVEGTDLHAEVLGGGVGGVEGGAPEAAGRFEGGAGLEVVGEVEGTGAGEEDRGTCGVELGGGDGEGGDV